MTLAESILRIAAVESPESFSTHLLWGRALLLLGEEERAVDVFMRCYHLDAARFLAQPVRARIRDAVVGGRDAAGLHERGDAAECDGDYGTALLRGDPPPERSDFVDGAEFRRFQAMPPLANTDLHDVDWNDLLERLARLPRSGETRESL